MNISPQDLQVLIDQYAPILRLNPCESYRNAGFDWFLAQPGVEARNAQGQPLPALPTGPESENAYLWYEWNGNRVQLGDMATAKGYVGVYDSSAYQPGGFEIQFWFWSPFNGPAAAQVSLQLTLHASVIGHVTLPLKFSVGLDPFGDHQGDWEHCRLIFSAERKLLYIVAAEHSYGTTYYPPGTPGQPTWSEQDGRPVLYSSLHGHATYGQPGRFGTEGGSVHFDKEASIDIGSRWLSFSLGIEADGDLGLYNDCADGGTSLDCRSQHELVYSNMSTVAVTSPTWTGFRGRCGDVDPPVGDVARQFDAEFTRAFVNALMGPLPHVLKDYAGKIVDAIVSKISPPIIAFLQNRFDGGFSGPHMPRWPDNASRKS